MADKSGGDKGNVLYPTYSDDLYTVAPSAADAGASGRSIQAFSGGRVLQIACVVILALWFGISAATDQPIKYSVVGKSVRVAAPSEMRSLLVPGVQEKLEPEQLLNEFNHQLLLELETRKRESEASGEVELQAIDASGVQTDYAHALQVSYKPASQEIAVDEEEGGVGFEPTVVDASQYGAAIRVWLNTPNPGEAGEWISALVSEVERRTALYVVSKTRALINREIRKINNDISNKRELALRARQGELKILKSALARAEELGIILPINENHPFDNAETDKSYQRGIRELREEIAEIEGQLDVTVQGVNALRRQIVTLESIRIDSGGIAPVVADDSIEVSAIPDEETSVIGQVILGAFLGLLVSWLLIRVLAILSRIRNLQRA